MTDARPLWHRALALVGAIVCLALVVLDLPPGNRADFIQEVLVPGGTRMQSSVATEAFGQPGRLLQFELLDQIPIKNFGPGVPFR